MDKKRQQWIDIAKGLAIGIVVFGHSQESIYNTYLIWFAMPLFFMISGMIFKPWSNWQTYKSGVIKKSIQLLIPYLSFLAIITAARYFNLILDNALSLQFIVKDILRLGFGGRFIGGPYGVFWFITCLLASYCILGGIFLLQKNTSKRLIIIACMYIAAHIESWIAQKYIIYIPWNVDAALLAVPYMAVGYYGKQYLKKITTKTTVTMLMISALFIIADYTGVIYYRFDFKNLIYTNIILAMVVPVTMSWAFLGICQLLEKLKLGKLIADIGQYTIPIMYLHIPIIIYLDSKLVPLVIILGVSIPWLLSKFVLQKFSLTKFLFLGQRETKPLTVNGANTIL